MPLAGRPQRWALAGALAALVAGCGGHAARDPTTPKPSGARTTAAPAAKTAHPPAPAKLARVIRRWSDTLRGGDEVGAARYFAVPSIVQIEPGQPILHITQRAQAIAFQAVLPCGARLLSTYRQGRYVNALFRLTMRPGATCDAPGQTARTKFAIRAGKITEWRRAPDEPGDGQGTTPSGGPAV